uniref:Uncharacterized protein n=1 Tax=Rhizochromulina marina TaxID=1034831 RepID=A0A7S2RK49_9STRA|mmetsp:Transcript_17488/g.51130  ORF Transcript_17488/g.51130 Transcript_17488/m.51130 type:complete len:251 (+) Transcript_17488:161-913(+)
MDSRDPGLYRVYPGPPADAYEAARLRIFGEDAGEEEGGGAGENAVLTRTAQGSPTRWREDPEREGEGEGGAVLSLDQVSYDRDMRWFNKPSDARPRRTLGKGSRAFNQIESIANDTREYAALDDHYRRLDQRKAEADRQLSARARHARGAESRSKRAVGAGGPKRPGVSAPPGPLRTGSHETRAEAQPYIRPMKPPPSSSNQGCNATDGAMQQKSLPSHAPTGSAAGAKMSLDANAVEFIPAQFRGDRLY